MLETPVERVKLLKAGVTCKKIEEMYILYNNFNIVYSPVLYELLEIDNNGGYCFVSNQDSTTLMCFKKIMI